MTMKWWLTRDVYWLHSSQKWAWTHSWHRKIIWNGKIRFSTIEFMINQFLDKTTVDFGSGIIFLRKLCGMLRPWDVEENCSFRRGQSCYIYMCVYIYIYICILQYVIYIYICMWLHCFGLQVRILDCKAQQSGFGSPCLAIYRTMSSSQVMVYLRPNTSFCPRMLARLVRISPNIWDILSIDIAIVDKYWPSTSIMSMYIYICVYIYIQYHYCWVTPFSRYPYQIPNQCQ